MGNTRLKTPSLGGHGEPQMGMDLHNEDFEWATTEIMKIADICCSGRVVSVLEGGYGSYNFLPRTKTGNRVRKSHSKVTYYYDSNLVISLKLIFTSYSLWLF